MSRAQTTTMTTINQVDLGRFPIPLPSLSEQKILADTLDEIESQVQVLEQHIYVENELSKKFINGILAEGADV